MPGSRRSARRRRQRVARWLARVHRQPVPTFGCGHRRDEANSYTFPNGGTRCRTCKVERSTRYRIENAEALQEKRRALRARGKAKPKSFKCGHPREGNTYIQPSNGKESCRTCQAARDANRVRKKPVKAVGKQPVKAPRPVPPEGPGGRWALVTWSDGDLAMQRAYYPTKAEAKAAAPKGAPHTVVDITQKGRPHTSVDAVLGMGRGVIEKPYARGSGRGGTEPPSII